MFNYSDKLLDNIFGVEVEIPVCWGVKQSEKSKCNHIKKHFLI